MHSGFEFSGHEPDNALLMTQTAPVQARQPYALTIDYTTSDIPPGSGLAWLVTDERTGPSWPGRTSLSAEHGGKAFACFTGPEGPGFVNLSLLYQRQPGTVRVEGRLAVRAVQLTIAAGGDCAPRKSRLPGLILRGSETTLKRQSIEGIDRLPGRRSEMTFGTTRRITAPTGTGNVSAARSKLDLTLFRTRHDAPSNCCNSTCVPRNQ